MSGILKGIGKIFKAIVSSPIFKVIAIAAAVYFTGGLALGAAGTAFTTALPEIAGATGAFDAGMTGIGAGAITGDAVATAAGASAGLDLSSAATGAFDAGNTAIGTGAITDSTLAEGSSGILAQGEGLTGAPDTSSLMNVSAVPQDASAVASATPASADVTSAATPAAAPDVTASNDIADFGGSQGTAANVLGSGLPANAGTNVFGQAAQGASNAVSGAMDWYSGLNPVAQNIIGQGISGIGKGALQAYSTQVQMDQRTKEINQQRADVVRRGGVPTMTQGSYQPAPYKAPGIVNAGTGA